MSGAQRNHGNKRFECVNPLYYHSAGPLLEKSSVIGIFDLPSFRSSRGRDVHQSEIDISSERLGAARARLFHMDRERECVDIRAKLGRHYDDNGAWVANQKTEATLYIGGHEAFARRMRSYQNHDRLALAKRA
ncbi:hypothetical protein PG996_006112 [Apiospora saccharicola]|uniref:Uncharacterized protein n=1 Tax=Apiospora saccharicola TaxID=335842 RepID=A0ABR1VNE2_9PEZI